MFFFWLSSIILLTARKQLRIVLYEDHLSVEALNEIMKDEPVIVILLQAIQSLKSAIDLKIGEILQLSSQFPSFPSPEVSNY
jgi:hypothetical protein